MASFAPSRLLPPLATGVYAGGAAALLPFYPRGAAVAIGLAAAAVTAFAPRLGLAFALAVPVFPLGNVSSGLALVYAAAAASAWVAAVTTRGAARRALGAAAAVILLTAGAAVRAGPIGLGIPGSRHPVAVAETVLGAAPSALAWQIPVAAVLALALPWAIEGGRKLGGKAVKARTYTG